MDVKTGLGAFMQTLQQAKKLAQMMVTISDLAGKKVVALLSDMNQPLGNAVGNSLEVEEAINVLKGGGPSDIYEHCVVLSSHMLVLGEVASDLQSARVLAEKSIRNGSAYEKFKSLVFAQGGDVKFIEDPTNFPKAKYVEDIQALQNGFVSQVHARLIGEASVLLGAGRSKKSDPIDHSVGIVVNLKVGDSIKAGEPMFTIHANNEIKMEETKRYLRNAIIIQEESVKPLPLFYN